MNTNTSAVTNEEAVNKEVKVKKANKAQKKVAKKKATVTVMPVNGAEGGEINLVMAAIIAKAKLQAAKPVAERKRKAAEPKDCACGCGGKTRGGLYVPGHNGKHFSALVKQFREEAAQKANQPAQ